MTIHSQTADVLDDAADYIEKHGLWQSTRWETSDGLCVLLAIDCAAASDVDLKLDACSALDRSLAPPAAGPDNDAEDRLVAWNDAAGRTQQEVLDAFRAAAKAERRLDDGLAP